jgi:hypothetical protein
MLTWWKELGCRTCAETVVGEGETGFAEGERVVGESHCSTRSRSWVPLLLGFLSSFCPAKLFLEVLLELEHTLEQCIVGRVCWCCGCGSRAHITRCDIADVDDLFHWFWDERWMEAVPNSIGDCGTKRVVVIVKTNL